jgi:hypothetical protein
VYGFLPHLDSRPSAQLLLQSITTEARQQMAYRQLAGAFPMPVWFETVRFNNVDRVSHKRLPGRCCRLTSRNAQLITRKSSKSQMSKVPPLSAN